ncbi:MAG: hypothetical protein QOF11_976 [Chloroflexota bacterium]|jgi:EAL domain-containing protein (putative c-di-GMP-specific phosphodiesterase class I)|nr:hypothetical protein [Chloroflexota bacterium]
MGQPRADDSLITGYALISDLLGRPLGRRLSNIVASTLSVDPTGVRRVLRHHLVLPTALIAAGVLACGALLGAGNATLYAVVIALILGQVVVDLAFERAGKPMPPDRRFLLVVLVWPVWFLILGAAGWSTGDDVEYFGDIVALVGLMVAGFVAFVLPFSVSIPWAAVAGGAVTVGALVAGSTNIETVLPLIAIVTGTLFAGQVRNIAESFLSSRRSVLAEIARHPASGDAFAVAAGIVVPLVELIPIRTATLLWFTDDDRTVLLAIAGVIPEGLEPGRALPGDRNRLLRERAATGPWIAAWTDAMEDQDYRRNIADSGIAAVAYVPIRHEGRLMGLMTGALGDAAGGVAALAEQLPILVEAAEIASVALAPRLLEHAAASTASQVIHDLIERRAFWPVFQPIFELPTNRIVGYEALTRFDTDLPTQEVFNQASIAGRLRDLEVATLVAAFEASDALPPDVWLSVNSSAALLSEGRTLGRLLRSVQRPVVIELSEHEVVESYGPIRAAIERLGPQRTLAVDDAGAGFASLRHILDARPTHVKLDIGLVHGLAHDPSRRALIVGFVHFAREAGFLLVAEGVETPAELATLRDLGVQYGQGFLLGRPERLTELTSVAS